MHRNFHDHPRGRAHGAASVRTDLPLWEHPTLELETDFASVSIVPIAPGEPPFCEVAGAGATPHADVTTHQGITRVRIDSVARAIEDGLGSGRFWEGPFWMRSRFHGHFPTHVVLHVPTTVHARVRSIGARVNVERLDGCHLEISTDAGTMQLADVRGRLVLSTNAGRIEGRSIAGSIDVSTSAGAIFMEILSLDPGQHRIHTNMGAARVDLAKGMPVRIDTRTAMGSARVDFQSVKDAPATLAVEADLGGIRVGTSRRAWAPRTDRAPSEPATPYRTAPSAGDAEPPRAPSDEDLNKVLREVAEGKLSAGDARELLRAMGWS